MTATDWRLRGAFFALLGLVAMPLIPLVLAHRIFVRRKGLVGFSQKLSGTVSVSKPGQVLLHGVSLGEVQLMRPLVPQFEQATGLTCVLSTTTETGRAALDEHFQDHDRCFLPLDLPWAVETFLSRVRPRALVLLELELWPNLIIACHRREIPVLLVNARLSERSFRGYHRARALLRPLMTPFALVCAQNAIWGARLRALGCPLVRNTGSMKADMVRLASPEAIAACRERLGLDPQRPLCLLASSSDPEEGPVLAAWQKSLKEHGWHFVIGPRHPERGAAVAEVVRSARESVWRSSLGELVTGDPIRVVDEIGQLGALYALADIAIVGGSLGSGRHGQNMLEAAAAGCCTIVGPDTSNFPDAMGLLRGTGGVLEYTVDELPEALAALAMDTDRRQAVGVAGTAAWRAGLGATDRVLQHLGTILQEDPRS